MTSQTFISECSSSRYPDCLAKNLFGSSNPRPLESKTGDNCRLRHYEIGGLPELWQEICHGGRNLMPKLLSAEKNADEVESLVGCET
jgi:hypothetical protein